MIRERKLIALVIYLMLILFIFSGCSQPGSIEKRQIQKIYINKKGYNVRWVYLDENSHGIYVVYPENDSLEVPKVINWTEQQDETTVPRASVTIQ